MYRVSTKLCIDRSFKGRFKDFRCFEYCMFILKSVSENWGDVYKNLEEYIWEIKARFLSFRWYFVRCAVSPSTASAFQLTTVRRTRISKIGAAGAANSATSVAERANRERYRHHSMLLNADFIPRSVWPGWNSVWCYLTFLLCLNVHFILVCFSPVAGFTVQKVFLLLPPIMSRAHISQTWKV